MPKAYDSDYASLYFRPAINELLKACDSLDSMCEDHKITRYLRKAQKLIQEALTESEQ